MFRFSIRDVLWLTVVGLALGWRIHMETILAAYKEHERLNSALVRGLEFEMEHLKKRLLACESEIAANGNRP